MTDRLDLLLWVALPYLALAIFVVGHVWRYRRGQLTWTSRSTQILERRLLQVGSLLFHFGILAVIGGHVLGILVPSGVTEAVGIDHDTYHLISILAGGTAGIAATLGILVLVYRRVAIGRVRASTPRSDLVMYPVLLAALVTGMLATFGPNLLLGEYEYRETVAPWFRGVFAFSPDPELMTGAPFLFQAHAVTAWLLFAVWPFSRLVHAWSIPVSYLARSWIPFRSRDPRTALAVQRARAARASEAHGARRAP